MMTCKILLFASNPQDTAQLLLNREIREIDDALENGKYRERFSSRFQVAVRIDDLLSSLQKESPRIVHFCGHGMGSQGLVLKTSSGQHQLLDTQAIADLFKLFKSQIECVVLNACYSQIQVTEISQHINYLISTKREIRDDAAISFSKGFYKALSNGETIEQAYISGCNRIQLDIYGSVSRERNLIPVYSEADGKYIELFEHEVIELLIKDPLNQIVNDFPAESRGSTTNITVFGNYNENIEGNYHQQYRKAILKRDFIARTPYKGLKKFNAKDQDLFFGRERLISKLIQAVNQSNLVLVLGASGSGKSSVVRAGAIPQLESLSEIPYETFLFTPNRDPFVAFHRILLTHVEDIFQDEEVEFVLQGNSDTLTEIAELFKSKLPESQCLIFIDQFEELFTLCPNLATRGNFIQSLIQIAQDSNNSVKLILAMRSDFLEELATYPQFARIAEKNIHLVADMQEGELRQAIEEPAAKHGIVFESGLVEEIILDVQGQAGSLPLLQYTLNLLWQNDDLSDGELNIVTYRQLGGVTGALQKHVNEIYQQLLPEQQLATRQILVRLVDVVALEKSEVLRTAVSKRAYKSEFTKTQAETVNLLINQSLLVSDDLSQEGQSTVEIAHEALLSSWAELKQWINDARNTISLNNRLAEDAARWQELKSQNLPKTSDELWSGSKLEKVIELRKDGTFQVVLGGLNELANKFIDESIEKRDKEQKDKIDAAQKLARESEARLVAEAQAREEAEKAKLAAEQAKIEAEKAILEAEKARQLQEKLKQEAEVRTILEANTNKKLRRRAWGLGIISFIAMLFGITAIYLRSQSQEAANEARLEQRAANIKTKLTLSNRLEFLLESLELVGDNQKFNQEQGWFKSSNNLLPGVQSVLFQAVQESKETFILNGHEDSVLSVSFSPDRKYLVTGSSDNMVRLWDLSSQTLIHIFKGHEDWVMSVDFSHDSKYIASASKDTKVKLWNVESKSLIDTFKGHKDVVMSVDFSQKSDYIVSGSHDTTVKLWDVKKPQKPIHTFNGHKKWVMSVGFSHDSNYIVSGGLDKKVKLWDVKNPQKPIHTFNGHLGAVNSVGFSPNDNYLVSGSKDKTVKLWNVNKKSLMHTFISHQSEVRFVDFSSDNKYLVSGSYDKTVKLWDRENKSLIHTFYGHQDSVRTVAFSSDDNYLVSGSKDKTVRLWDVSSRSLIHTFGDRNAEDRNKSVFSVDFSSDGKYLASGTYDSMIKLWNVKNPQVPIRTFNGHNKSVLSVDFSHDGKYLVSGSRDETVKLWNVNNSQAPIHTFNGHQAIVLSVDFSHDGKYLVSGSDDSMIKLWDVKNPQAPIRTFNGHQSGVRFVSFSHDGKYLVSGSDDKTIKLWDVKNPQAPIHTFNGHQSEVRSVGFSHDGKYIVSGSFDETVKLWRGTDWQDWLQIGCERIRLHPILTSRELSSASGAANTCLKHGDWTNQEIAEFLVNQRLAFAREKSE